MQTLRVSGDAPEVAALERACEVLLGGGLLIYPTDTLYALGGRALDPAVARHVLRAKGRKPGNPLPLVAADLPQARSLCAEWPSGAERLAMRFWPGPLTLVLPAADAVPHDVSQGSGTVAVRVPGLLLTRRLCAGAGCLIATSANISGGAAPVSCEQAVAAVGGAVELALDAGPGRALPSTIVTLSDGPPRVLREGVLRWAEVSAVLIDEAS